MGFGLPMVFSSTTHSQLTFGHMFTVLRFTWSLGRSDLETSSGHMIMIMEKSVEVRCLYLTPFRIPQFNLKFERSYDSWLSSFSLDDKWEKGGYLADFLSLFIWGRWDLLFICMSLSFRSCWFQICLESGPFICVSQLLRYYIFSYNFWGLLIMWNARDFALTCIICLVVEPGLIAEGIVKPTLANCPRVRFRMTHALCTIFAMILVLEHSSNVTFVVILKGASGAQEQLDSMLFVDRVGPFHKNLGTVVPTSRTVV